MRKLSIRVDAGLICALTVLLMVSASTQAARPVIVTETQNGKTVAVTQGSLLVISLASNPGTGFSWQTGKNDNSILKFVDESAFPPRMPGAPSSQLLKFKALAPGTDGLQLVYRRPWEKGVAPAKTFSVTVTVK